VKAAYPKWVRAVWAADGGQRVSAPPPTRVSSDELTRRFWAWCLCAQLQRYQNATHSLPPGKERKGTAAAGAIGCFPLLLVVHSGAADLFALRVGSARADSAGFASSRQDDPAGSSDLVTLLDDKRYSVLIDFLERPRV
jgi:hypothetical protein